MTDFEIAEAIIERIERGVPAHREMTHAEQMALARSWADLRDTIAYMLAVHYTIGEQSMSLGEPRK